MRIKISSQFELLSMNDLPEKSFQDSNYFYQLLYKNCQSSSFKYFPLKKSTKSLFMVAFKNVIGYPSSIKSISSAQF